MVFGLRAKYYCAGTTGKTKLAPQAQNQSHPFWFLRQLQAISGLPF
jgi:hypothetical protein